jgi:hypothetical protein
MRALLHESIIAKDSRPPSATSHRLAGFVRGLAIGGTMETTSVWHFEHDEPLLTADEDSTAGDGHSSALRARDRCGEL